MIFDSFKAEYICSKEDQSFMYKIILNLICHHKYFWIFEISISSPLMVGSITTALLYLNVRLLNDIEKKKREF